MIDLAQVLQQSETAREDIETLLTTQILFWLLGRPGRAREELHSIRLLAGGQYRLTPLYDVMSIWPVEGKGANQWSWFRARLAMAVSGKNRHYAFRDIQRRHFNAMAPRCSYGQDAEPIIQRLIARTPGVIEHVSGELPEGFPAKVADRIFEGLRQTVATLEAMPAKAIAASASINCAARRLRCNPTCTGFASHRQGTSRKYPSFDESRIRNETIPEIAHNAVMYQ